MKRTIWLSALFFSVLLVSQSAGQKSNREGPFGLIWGSSPEEARAQGVELKELAGKEFGSSFTAANLPLAIADQETSILAFGYDDKLWRILAISKPFNNDPTGANLKTRYTDLSAVLSEKYGKPAIFHSLGDSIYSQPQYFLAGVRGGDTKWFANFETPALLVQIGLVAEDSSTGRWRMIFEDRAIKRSFESSRRSREKGAL